VTKIATINDLQSPWRKALMPASFRGAMFHVEAGGKESGRRIVLHQFPKRDTPYPEDMGRRAYTFTVRGYFVQFGSDNGPDQGGNLLTVRDYRLGRDALIAALEQEGPGMLQLPTTKPLKVVCPQYHWTEDREHGGFVVFDMQFLEYGQPLSPPVFSQSTLDALSRALGQQVVASTGGDAGPSTTNPTVPGSLY
jgi:prophage DNA circulation protein